MARPPEAERLSPRISANELARYMVSSDTARMGILRRAKFPQSAPLIRYKDVRLVICTYLSDPNRNVNPLVTSEEMFKQRAEDPALSPFWQEDAKSSIEVLHAIQRMKNTLAGFTFALPSPNQPKLMLSGVEISIWADLIVYGVSRGTEQIGLAVLRMTQDDADTDEAKERRRSMGLFVATLARMHLDQNLPTNREPANRLCMSIDIQHGEAFAAPASNSRRVNDLTNACAMIAAIWPQISN